MLSCWDDRDTRCCPAEMIETLDAVLLRWQRHLENSLIMLKLISGWVQEATTTSEREGRSSSLILPNSASFGDASVCSTMKLILRPLSVGLAVLSFMVEFYRLTWSWLNESGWTSPVEWVRLKESGWMSPDEWWQRLRTLRRITLPADRSVRRTHWLWITTFAYRTGCGSPLMITHADPSVDDHTDCGSQRSADPLTVDHTVRVSHRLRITVSGSSMPFLGHNEKLFSLKNKW